MAGSGGFIAKGLLSETRAARRDIVIAEIAVSRVAGRVGRGIEKTGVQHENLTRCSSERRQSAVSKEPSSKSL